MSKPLAAALERALSPVWQRGGARIAVAGVGAGSTAATLRWLTTVGQATKVQWLVVQHSGAVSGHRVWMIRREPLAFFSGRYGFGAGRAGETMPALRQRFDAVVCCGLLESGLAEASLLPWMILLRQACPGPLIFVEKKGEATGGGRVFLFRREAPPDWAAWYRLGARRASLGGCAVAEGRRYLLAKIKET